MKKNLLIAFCIFAVAVFFHFAGETNAQTESVLKREQLYRFNNLGVAFMEQYKHEDAIREFKQALAADSSFAPARINLAMAFFFLNDSKTAIEEARAAIKVAPESLQAHYILGAALRNEKSFDEAITEFKKVLASDPGDPATNIQIGQILSQKQQYADAVGAFRIALDAEPFNATAAYSLAQALIRSGNAAEGQKMLAKFQQLRSTGYATTLGNVYGEKGRYAEATVSTGAEPDLVQPAQKLTFIDATSSSGISQKTDPRRLNLMLGRKIAKADFNEQMKNELISAFGSRISLADFNNDSRQDLIMTGVDAGGKPFLKLYQNNEGGKFADVTEKSRITAGGFISGAICGDFDNDEKTDVAVFGYRNFALWKNNGDGSFSDITAKSGLPVSYVQWAMSAVWFDSDHDGDLDLYLGNFAELGQWPVAGESAIFPDDFSGQPNRHFRNNGNGSFTEITEQSGLGGGNNKTTSVVATDFNNQRDIDLLVVNYNAPAQLFSNQRDGSFKDVAAPAGLTQSFKALSVAVGDLNKDNYVDLYFPQNSLKDALFLSNGRGGFSRKEKTDDSSSLFAQMTDIDNDGLLDVVLLSGDTIKLRRGLGGELATPAAVSSVFKAAETGALSSADINGDGGIDLVTIASDGSPAVLQSEGFGKNFARLSLAGKTSNRSAIGVKAELRSGSLRQKIETYSSSPAPASAGIQFGLGYRTGVDSLQLYWPAGILQSELSIKANANNSIDELDRKGTSCPLLYAWNGSEYSFVTDFLGGSAIGSLTGPGTWNYPDTNEYIRVTGDQLKERNGLLSIRMNNQLEEVIFFDQVRLLAVDHPADTEIHPNERLLPGPPYPEFKIFTTKSSRPPVSATDDKGNDILPLIKDIDRKYPEDFEKLQFKGYAKEHAITIYPDKIGPGKIGKTDRILLLMTAWIDYADSTSNLSASQAGEKLVLPYVQVVNARGEWETVVPQMGFPAGLPKTMTVDLTGKFITNDHRIRIVTGMRIYWDQILVDTFSEGAPIKVTTLDPVSANLHWRGFPREYSPDGRMPLIYDYRIIEPAAPWKAHQGSYTRFGDVRELLLATDDMYVITRNGDEMQVDFNARRLPVLPSGWKRTYLVFADGFGKDMDINSARPETIGELPFHGMKSYPWSKSDHYPMTKRHLEYLEKYNTRIVGEPLQASWRGVK